MRNKNVILTICQLKVEQNIFFTSPKSSPKGEDFLQNALEVNITLKYMLNR